MGGVAKGVDPWAIDSYPDPDDPEVMAGVSAEDARYLLGGMMSTDQPLKAFCGIIPEGGNEAGNPTGLLVETTSPASLQVLVNPGRFVAQGSADASPYLGGLKGPALVDVTPGDPTNPRIDLIVGDPSPGDPPSKVYLIDGTPANEPAEPDLPDGCVKLGTVTVPAGAQNITQVVPYRVFTCAVGGVRLVWNDQGLDLPGYPGQLRNHDGSLDQWDHLNDRWSVIHGRRIPFTPILRNASNGVFGFGAGATINAWYQFLQRDVVHVSIAITFGTNPGTATGQLHFDLPPRATPAPTGTPGDQGAGQLDANLRVPGYTNVRGLTIWRGMADARPQGLFPYFPMNWDSSGLGDLRTSTNGQNGTGTPAITQSATLFNGVALTVHGTYEVTPGADSA